MTNGRDARGFSMIEMLVSLVVLSLVLIGLASLLIQSSRINRTKQMAIEVQANARNTMELVLQRVRSAGWDPSNVGIAAVLLDPENVDANHADGVDNIEIFADFNGDGETDGTTTNDDSNEELRIRHTGDRLEWRTEAGGAFMLVSDRLTNDADGDGTPEPMFVPDAVPDPTRITIQITAQSPVADPTTGEFIRYTLSSQVALRKEL